MKLKNLFFLAVLTLGSFTVFAQISKLAPKVVVIGIGEKNATLDENQYPNLKFYYTPELQNIGDETFSGKPASLNTSSINNAH